MNTILIQFDEDDNPTFSINVETDTDEKKLKVIVDKIVEVIKACKDE